MFPVLMIVGAIIAYQTPETFVGFKPYLNPMLMFIMFAMGLTITLPDLKEVARRPWSIALGRGVSIYCHAFVCGGNIVNFGL
nr:hypothetical protein [Corynebacterium diphtheriae]